MPRRPSVSPERILAAAALEFAERGYAGARVDRIARRARVNKAMLYYHFTSKRELYRTLLRQTFGALAAALREITATPSAPDERLRNAVATIAAFVESHAHFPAIMLREMAEGGSHVDAETLTAIPRAFIGVLQPGIEAGYYRPMHPVAAYFTTVAPIIMFVASAPLRKQLEARQLLPSAEPLTAQSFLAHLTTSLDRAFANHAPVPRHSHA